MTSEFVPPEVVLDPESGKQILSMGFAHYEACPGCGYLIGCSDATEYAVHVSCAERGIPDPDPDRPVTVAIPAALLRAVSDACSRYRFIVPADALNAVPDGWAKVGGEWVPLERSRVLHYDAYNPDGVL